MATDKKWWKNLVKMGKSGSGSLAGTAGGLVGAVGASSLGVPPPLGTAIGSAIGRSLHTGFESVAEDFSQRQSSVAEVRRQETLIEYARVLIWNAELSNLTLRQDEFFTTEPNGRNRFEEIADATLRKARNESEERKLPFLAHFICALAYRPDVPAETATTLLRSVDALTYRQFCVLALAGQHKSMQVTRLLGLPITYSARWDSLRLEILGMQPMFFGNRDIVEGGVIPLASIGQLAFEMLGLDGVPEDDLEDLQQELEAFHVDLRQRQNDESA